MKEVRLSIPFVGGITVVLTKEEVDQKKAQAKKHFEAGVASVKFFAKRAHVNTVKACNPAVAWLCDYSNRVLAEE